jgi:TRAP-type C4-dicarboxylate transport system substrate-binding protein
MTTHSWSVAVAPSRMSGAHDPTGRKQDGFRRIFAPAARGLFAASVLALAAAAGTTPARAFDVVLVNDVPDGHPRLKYALRVEADVERASGGSIRVITNRSLPGKAGLDALLARKAQIATVNTAHLEALDPRIGFVNLPFGMNDAAMERPGVLERTMVLMQRQLDAKGLVILGVMRGADNLFVFKQRKLRSPSDLAGVRLRVTGEGVYEKIMRSLGAEPVPMPIGAIKAAIIEGKVEGTSTSPGGWTSQLGMTAPVGTLVPGFMMLTYTYVAEKSWLDSLSPKDRTILERAIRSNSTLQWRSMHEDDMWVIDDFVKQGGSYNVVPDAELPAWRAKVAPVLAEFETKYPDVMKSAREILAAE